jgi:hypothetical protein
MQGWNGARDTSSGRIRLGSKLPEEPEKDAHSRGDVRECGRQHWNKDSRLKEATISEKREDIWKNLRENRGTGNREANSRIFCRVTKNQGLDTVEGLVPSETEE